MQPNDDSSFILDKNTYSGGIYDGIIPDNS